MQVLSHESLLTQSGNCLLTHSPVTKTPSTCAFLHESLTAVDILHFPKDVAEFEYLSGDFVRSIVSAENHASISVAKGAQLVI